MGLYLRTEVADLKSESDSKHTRMHVRIYERVLQ